MSDLPWSFFDQFDHGIGDLNPSVPMSFPHTETVEASSASEAELILLQFMVDAAATPPLHSAELGTLQPLPADPLASTGFTSVAERERLENHITEIFAAPAPPPPPAVPALPPVALTRPAFQPLLPSQSMSEEKQARCLLGVNYQHHTLQMAPVWVLIPESLFPLPHGIEAYAQANSIAVENFRGYVADLCGILPLYVPRQFMGHFSPIGKLQEEGAQRSTEDSLLYVNVLAASSFKHIYPNLDEYIRYNGLTRSSDNHRWIYASQSKILIRNEVLRHETFSLWQHSLFIPLGSPNSLEPSPAAVTWGQWSAWVSNIANDLPTVTKFYPRWAPRLAKCLGACQIILQYEVFCGRFLHNGVLQVPPQNFSQPPELRLRRIWEKVREVLQLPEVETVVRWSDASPTRPLGQDPFLKPLLHMQWEIGRNIRVITHFIVSTYFERNRVSAMDFILTEFQLSAANLAAGFAPAVDLPTAEKTLASPRTGCPFAHPLLLTALRYLMNRDLLLMQPLDCDPALPRTVAAFLRRATPTGATPPKIISYVATELLTAVLWATCEDPEVAAFPALSTAAVVDAMHRRYAVASQSSVFSPEMAKLACQLTHAYSLKPRMTE